MKLNSHQNSKDKSETLTQLCKDLLNEIGENPDRPGLNDTPDRFSQSMKFLTSGYKQSPEEVVGTAIFPENSSGLVFIQDIEFYSLCEHHLLPFFGRAHVAYLPNERVIGLSKIPRVLELYSRRLQVQERLTRQVADSLQDVLRPKGVFVLIEASHLCMMMRGVQKQESKTVTQVFTGIFEKDVNQRTEVMEMLKLHIRHPY